MRGTELSVETDEDTKEQTVKGWREKEMEGSSWRWKDKEDGGRSRGLKGEDIFLSSVL